MTMTIAEIQSRVDAMPAKLLAKGIAQPSVDFRLNANMAPEVYTYWYDEVKDAYGSKYRGHTVKGKTPAEAIAAAEAWIASLPSAEEAKLQTFMTALGDVIDLGRKNNIEVGFVSPLVETMKRLSENVITHQRAPAE